MSAKSIYHKEKFKQPGSKCTNFSSQLHLLKINMQLLVSYGGVLTTTIDPPHKYFISVVVCDSLLVAN